MNDDYMLSQMLEALTNKRNKLAKTIVVCHDEGYNINSRKANLFCLCNIVSDCYAIAPQLSAIQRTKLLNITRKLLAF